MTRLLLFFFFVSLCLCSAVDATPSSQTIFEQLAGYTVKTIAVALLLLGLPLIFFGKRLDRIFLGFFGFTFSAVLCADLIFALDDKWNFKYSYHLALLTVMVIGPIGCWFAVKFPKFGIMSCAGFGGHTIAGYLLAIEAGKLIAAFIVRKALTFILSASFVVASWFFTDIILIISSAFGGSMTVGLAVDVLANKFQLYYSLGVPGGPRELAFILEMVAIPVLAAAGMGFQFWTKNRKHIVTTEN